MNNLAYYYPSIILVLIILVVAFIIMFLFFRNSIGFGQFNHKASEIETVKPPRIAPAFFYNKQRTFRFCYAAFIAFDTILLISSLFFSTFTAYMILVPTLSPQITVVFLVVSTLSLTLKSTLNLDRRGKPYIEAVRLLEFAIVQYEYGDASLSQCDNPSDISAFHDLIVANEAAENLISQKNE